MPVNKITPIIKVNNVSFSYNSTPILQNITFSVRQGEYLGIIGPNGGGKTTLLKIILGLLKPTQGEVLVNDRRPMGYVPQRVSQSEGFPATVEEIVQSGRTQLLKDNEAVTNALKISGIEKLKNKRIGNLSGGEKQRVFIARALAGSPKILILDEPSIGVDIAHQQSFYEFLKHLNHAFGLTIIFVSHDVDVVADQVHTVLCLNRVLVSHGSPKDFLNSANLSKVYGTNVKFVLHGH